MNRRCSIPHQKQKCRHIATSTACTESTTKKPPFACLSIIPYGWDPTVQTHIEKATHRVTMLITIDDVFIISIHRYDSTKRWIRNGFDCDVQRVRLSYQSDTDAVGHVCVRCSHTIHIAKDMSCPNPCETTTCGHIRTITNCVGNDVSGDVYIRTYTNRFRGLQLFPHIQTCQYEWQSNRVCANTIQIRIANRWNIKSR